MLACLNTEERALISLAIPGIHPVHFKFSGANSILSLHKLSQHYIGCKVLSLDIVNILLKAPYIYGDISRIAIHDWVSYIILDQSSELTHREKYFLNHSCLNLLEDIKVKYPLRPYRGLTIEHARFDRALEFFGKRY
jgi:hypothetical protein